LPRSRICFDKAVKAQFRLADLAQAQTISARLGGPDWAEINEFDPPKPKWIRWRTYQDLIDRTRRRETVADERVFILINPCLKES
jgi:hypothetical protein